MRYSRAMLWASAICMASMTLGGCTSDLPSSPTNEVLGSEPELTAAVMDRMLERLGRGLALSLKDPAVRAWVSSEIASSPYVEYRIPIRDKVLNELNRPELRAIGRAAALTADDVRSIRAFPHLELYLPIAEQRASWRGGADVQVAVRRSSEDYTLFQIDGSQTVVPQDHTSTRPTLVLAISEIDYSHRESAVRGGPDTGDGMLARQSSFAPPVERPGFSVLSMATTSAATMDPDPSQWTRSYAQYIYVRHDDAFSGDDEMEIFGYMAPYNECRRYTGLKVAVQYFRTFPNTEIGLAEAIATAVPRIGDSQGLLVEPFEDDSGDCVRTSSDDPYGYVALTREDYNRQWDLRFLSTGLRGDARLGFTEFVRAQRDPSP